MALASAVFVPVIFATPSVSAAQVAAPVEVEALSGEELYIDRLGCWNCHGMTGGGGAGPAISETALSLRTFAAYLRLPSGEMPRVSARLASDGDLATIYRWLDGIEAPSDPFPVELSLEASAAAGGAQSEVTLIARAGQASLDSGLDTGALEYRITLQTMVPWVREKTPVAGHILEFQFAGQEDWSTLTTDELGEAFLGADASGASGVQLRTQLPEGRHTLVVEALRGDDPSARVVVGIATVVLRGSGG